MKLSTLFSLSVTLLFLFVQPSFTETSLIEVDSSRQLGKVVIPGSFLAVQLNCSLTGNITGLIITEQIPSEFKFVNSSSNPLANAVKSHETASEVKWLFINLQQRREITIKYTVEVPINVEDNTYTFEGYWKAVGYETEASGISPTSEIQVERVRTSSTISCNVSQSKIKVGEWVTVSGLISPVHANAMVTLNYTKPDTSTIVRNVTTSLESCFQDTIEVDSEGSWSVIAGWRGDEDNKGAMSSVVFFSAENSIGSTIPIHFIAILVLVAVVALIIIVILAWRHGFATGGSS